MEKQTNLYALILAGGSGTRLWPMSRKKTPKHFLRLHSELSMIQETAERIRGLVGDDHIFVVTNTSQVAMVKEHLPYVKPEHIIAEPAAKNTAWAMGLGAYFIGKANPNATIVNLAADHVIGDQHAFIETVLAAQEAANWGDFLLTIGITPTFPHTGLGYIGKGDEHEKVGAVAVYSVTKFAEKPDHETAKQFVDSKQYYWNANLYTWHVNAIKKALHEHAPQVAAGLDKIDPSIWQPNQDDILKQVYDAAEDAQIDKGVSEKATNLLMIEGNFGWDDIGDWGVLYDIRKKQDGEVLALGENAEIINVDSKNTLVHTDGRLVATIGLDNIVIIDTPNALLVCAKDRVQDVKKVVEQLKAENKSEYL